jgi:hypothetical protein
MISRLLEGLYSTSKHQNLTIYTLFYIFTASFNDKDDFSVSCTDHNLEGIGVYAVRAEHPLPGYTPGSSQGYPRPSLRARLSTPYRLSPHRFVSYEDIALPYALPYRPLPSTLL